MSDSVDRVFSHALNTVNRIRTGAEKPPASVRLKLYGLYKQAMEGDVEGIMERPEGSDESAKRAREKWDAWKSQSRLSRTEAKRRYISTLISTMQKYASPSPDARELVSELEFVWDQVKSNVPSSSSSSPLLAQGQSTDYRNDLPKFNPPRSTPPEFEKVRNRDGDGMRVLSPLSQSQEETQGEEEEEAEEGGEEFVDARDSQIAEAPPRNNRVSLMSQESSMSQASRDRDIPGPSETRPKGRRKSSGLPSASSSRESEWRKRIECSLIKMTAEVAALREQLESRRLLAHTLRFRIASFLSRLIWGIAKHLAMDVFLLGLVLLWLRRKKDRRFEGAIRVLLGDAVAQVQRVGEKQLGKIQLPGIVGGSKKRS